MNVTKKTKGFTIIEVVLVLAIAGLIFLMVFVALPALQRSQRDTQRKDDLARLQVAITSYASNNRGALPTFTSAVAINTFVAQYLTPTASDTFVDPLGAITGQASQNTYNLTSNTTANLTGTFDSSTQNIIYFSSGYTCGTAGSSVTAGSSRTIAFRMYLEGGGVYCLDN